MTRFVEKVKMIAFGVAGYFAITAAGSPRKRGLAIC